MGNAIFSKFPIDERVTHILPRLSSCPNAGSVNRALVGVRVTAPNGQKFNIWNTHLTAGMSGRAPEQRLEQAKWIADYLDHTVPLILGGDFNDVPGSPTHETFLHVGWLDANREAGPTHSASRIDYVWLKRMLFDSAISPALPEPEAGEKKLSDHRPVIVDASF